MDKGKLVRVLRQLATMVETMSDSDLDNFFADMRLAASVESKSVPRRAVRHEKLDPANLDHMLDDLNAVLSREAAADYLKKHQLTRRELAAMAKRSQVYIAKEDTVSAIEEKLVESVVGARLNSLAIRGEKSQSR